MKRSGIAVLACLCAAAAAAAPGVGIEERVAQLMKELPGREPMSGKGMPTKLGLLYIMGETESAGFFQLAETGRVPIVKTGEHSTDRSWAVRKHNPKAIWVLSGGCPLERESRTPKEAADAVYDDTLRKWSHVPEAWKPLVDFMEVTPCMWEPKTVEAAQWYCEFLCEFLPRFAKLGPRPIVLNSGVGGLPVDDNPKVLEAMIPGLRLAHHLGGAWGCHGYTLKYSKDPELESWFSLRYRRAYGYFKEHHPELTSFPMILLEGGVDDKGDPDKDGWLARGTLEQYTDWLAWYDAELKKDDYVLGVTLFKIGAPSIWKSFELEPVVPWLLEHYRRMHRAADPGP